MKNAKKMSLLLLATAFTLQGCATPTEKKAVSEPSQAATTPAAKPAYVTRTRTSG